MPRPVHFELMADDLDRAQGFYSDVFGWRFQAWGEAPYRLADTSDRGQTGINGALVQREEGWQPVVNTIAVDDLDAFVDTVVAAGGTLVVPRQAIPGVGYQAYCADTEGNVFGLHQADNGAA